MASPAVVVVDHPAVAHRLTRLRDARTDADTFRLLLEEITTFVAYEALRDLATAPWPVSTPLADVEGRRITEAVLVVPIMRAGLGMVAGVQRVVPDTEVAHLGMRRDEETLLATTYLDGLPGDLRGRRVVVCDPMLATGGTLIQGCRMVLERGPAAVTALCILASAAGLERIRSACPSVRVTCAAVDDELDHRGYIVPGLGDAGDRLFGPPP